MLNFIKKKKRNKNKAYQKQLLFLRSLFCFDFVFAISFTGIIGKTLRSRQRHLHKKKKKTAKKTEEKKTMTTVNQNRYMFQLHNTQTNKSYPKNMCILIINVFCFEINTQMIRI